MAKKQEEFVKHGDDSAPAGVDSPATYAPIDRTRTDPDEGLPKDTPNGCDPSGFTFPATKEA